MANNSTQTLLRARVDAFVQDLDGLVRQAALDAVSAALGTEAPARRRPGRPRKRTTQRAERKATRKPEARKTATRRPAAGRVRRGARRSEDAVAAVAERVLAYVRANPGSAISDIKAGLGLGAKDLQLPVKKLVASRKLRTTGQKRGTRYQAGARRRRSAKKTAKRKPVRKTAKRKATNSRFGRPFGEARELR